MATLAPRERALRDRQFFTITSLAMVAVIAIGFAPSFYLRGYFPAPFTRAEMIPSVALHGLVFTAWLALYVAQVWLAATGRIALHRRLGRIGWIMLPLLVILGAYTALIGVGRPTAPPGIPPLSWLAMPLLDVPVYGLLIALGLRHGIPREVHKRLMYLSLVVMMPPGFGRWQVPPEMFAATPLPPPVIMTVLLPMLFILALIGWDVATRGRPMRVTLVAGGAVMALWLLKPIIWSSAAWLGFAAWVSAPFV